MYNSQIHSFLWLVILLLALVLGIALNTRYEYQAKAAPVEGPSPSVIK